MTAGGGGGAGGFAASLQPATASVNAIMTAADLSGRGTDLTRADLARGDLARVESSMKLSGRVMDDAGIIYRGGLLPANEGRAVVNAPPSSFPTALHTPYL